MSKLTEIQITYLSEVEKLDNLLEQEQELGGLICAQYKKIRELRFQLRREQEKDR